MINNALFLSAGYGKRLGALTAEFPKCLMPVYGCPVLRYWLDLAGVLRCNQAIVNTHFKAELVEKYICDIEQPCKILIDKENVLLGTSGTILRHSNTLRQGTSLVAHADNFSIFDVNEFLNAHLRNVKDGFSITMMAFETMNPEECGIIEHNENDVVVNFHEKTKNPPGNLANAAVFLIEPEFFDWFESQAPSFDFSADILPKLRGKLKFWKNDSVHVDIGTLPTLRLANQLASGKGQNLSLLSHPDWYNNHDVHRTMRKLQII